MNVFDSSALLAYVLQESGADVTRSQLESGGVCSAVNWSEVAQRVIAAGADWDLTAGLILSYPIRIEPVTADDAVDAARLWRAGSGLSLGDRLCLALGARLSAEIWTADRAWQGLPGVRLIR